MVFRFFSIFPNPKLIKLDTVVYLSKRSLRIGAEIPNDKKIEYSLQYIHGIGRSRARQILSKLNIVNKITKDLCNEEIIALRDEVNKYMIEGDLRRLVAHDVERLKAIQCYRGARHMDGLSCRGQRTKTNCWTMKGKKGSITGK